MRSVTDRCGKRKFLFDQSGQPTLGNHHAEFLSTRKTSTQSLRHKAIAEYHDPIIATIPNMREHPTLAGRKSVPYSAAQLKTYDAVVITTEHSSVDYALLAKHAKLIVDTRNAMTRRNLTGANVVKA